MIILALLPLGLLSIQQTSNTAREVARNREVAAAGATLQAAGPQIRTIQHAQSITAALAAAVPDLIGDETACRAVMDRAQAQIPMATLVAYTPLTGLMTCASGGRTFDFTDNPRFERLIEKPVPMIVVSPRGAVSGVAALGISHPVFDAAGLQTGIVTITLPHETISHPAPANPGAAPLALITFDGEGNLLTADGDLDAAALHLPTGRSVSTMANGGATSFADLAVSGERRFYSVVPLGGNLFLLGVWRLDTGDTMVDPAIAPYLLPGLMWLAALAVAVFAADHLVTRHVRQMADAMMGFVRGDRSHRLKLRNPPAEIADLAEAYAMMTSTILRDEAELENLLRQKEHLLREVHHRTGNSLQLIASVLRLHLRERPDPEVRRMLEDLHGRVMSLSSVHLSLYRIAGEGAVDMQLLMTDVIAKVGAVHDRYSDAASIETDLGAMMLATEQAVPLALLVAEVLSSFPPGAAAGDAPVRVSLRRCTGEADPDLLTGPGGRGTDVLAAQDAVAQARMRISGPADARSALTGESGDAPSRIASRLMRAFVGQLGGELAIGGDDRVIVAEISFPIRES